MLMSHLYCLGNLDAVSNSFFCFVLWCHSSKQLNKCTQLCVFSTKPVQVRIEIQHLNNQKPTSCFL